MRTRALALIAGLTIVAFLAAMIGSQRQASARLQRAGTPAATPAEQGTPVAAETPTPSGIVTIVMWYQQNASGEILQLFPVTSDDGVVYAEGTAESDTQRGRVVFEEARNQGYPRIRIGNDNYFDAYPVSPAIRTASSAGSTSMMIPACARPRW